MDIAFHQGYRPGCIGRIVELHAGYYARHAGFGVHFESRVARELAAFCEDYTAERDGLWLALVDEQVEGAIAIDGSRAAADGAHLRWFIVSDVLRGQGIGKRLLTDAIDVCRTRAYDRVHLSTFAGLDAARHLYEAQGFRLMRQQRGTQWGHAVEEQEFELSFQPTRQGEHA
jgi:GNAT superfamily N-acetyltransferase